MKRNHIPVVGADKLWPLVTMKIDGFDSVEFEKCG
jgi:hypothetical protein